MSSIKVLLISFTITLVTLFTIAPANANPTVKMQHLNVSNKFTTQFNSYDIIDVASKVPSNLSINYRNSLFTALLISNPITFNKKHARTTMDSINESSDFFTSAMVFNDKLHQLISYFTIPPNESITGSAISTSENEVIKKKCSSTLDFS
jgi:hypothetical protein